MLFSSKPDTSFYEDDYVAILIDGTRRASCHKDHLIKHMANIVSVSFLHFKEIADEIRKGNPKIVVVSGSVFAIGFLDDNPKGYGGRTWHIRFHDGRAELTNSLWCLGEVPDNWARDIPDNAVFV